jgi:hypothetical protein
LSYEISFKNVPEGATHSESGPYGSAVAEAAPAFWAGLSFGDKHSASARAVGDLCRHQLCLNPIQPRGNDAAVLQLGEKRLNPAL